MKMHTDTSWKLLKRNENSICPSSRLFKYFFSRKVLYERYLFREYLLICFMLCSALFIYLIYWHTLVKNSFQAPVILLVVAEVTWYCPRVVASVAVCMEQIICAVGIQHRSSFFGKWNETAGILGLRKFNFSSPCSAFTSITRPMYQLLSYVAAT